MSSPEDDEKDKAKKKDREEEERKESGKAKDDVQPSVSKEPEKDDAERDIYATVKKQLEDWIEDDEKPLVLKLLVKSDKTAEPEQEDDATIAKQLIKHWMQEEKEKPVLLKVVKKDDSKPESMKEVVPEVIIRMEDDEGTDSPKYEVNDKIPDDKIEFETLESILIDNKDETDAKKELNMTEGILPASQTADEKQSASFENQNKELEDEKEFITIDNDTTSSAETTGQRLSRTGADTALLQHIENKIEDFVEPSKKDFKSDGATEHGKEFDEKPSVSKDYEEYFKGETVGALMPGILKKPEAVDVVDDKPREEAKADKADKESNKVEADTVEADKVKADKQEADVVDIDKITEIVKEKIRALEKESSRIQDDKINQLIRETVRSMLKADTKSDKFEDKTESKMSLDDSPGENKDKIGDQLKKETPDKVPDLDKKDEKQKEEVSTKVEKIKDELKDMLTQDTKKRDQDEDEEEKEKEKLGSKINDTIKIKKTSEEASSGEEEGVKKETIGDNIHHKIKHEVKAQKTEDSEEEYDMKGTIGAKIREKMETQQHEKKGEDRDKEDDKKGTMQHEKSGDSDKDNKKGTLGDKIKDKFKSITKHEKAQIDKEHEHDDKRGKTDEESDEKLRNRKTIGEKIKDKVKRIVKPERKQHIKDSGDNKGKKDDQAEEQKDDEMGQDQKSDKLEKDDKSEKSYSDKGDKKGLKRKKSLEKKSDSGAESEVSFSGQKKTPSEPRFKEMSKPSASSEYDYRANRTNLTRSNSLWETIVHMLMCGLSGGIVALHEAYKDCGVWTALGINLFMSAIVPYGVCILVWSAQKLYGRVQQATLTYPDVAEAAFAISSSSCLRRWARPFRYLVEANLIFHGFASCSVFQVMIARNLKQLVDGEEAGAAHVIPIGTYTLILMLPCLLVCLVTDLKNVAPFALIANTYTVGLCITEVIFVLEGKQSANIEEVPAYKDVYGVFTFIGICIFTLGSAHVALPLENNMNEPKKFHYVLLGSVPPVTVCMATMGVLGYWVHGEKSITPVTVHLPFQPFPVTVQVFLCLMLYVIFAVSFYLAFDVEWFYLRRNHHASNHWFWERLYRSLHIVVVTLMAYFLPYATRVMGLIGCIASPTIFIYPLIIELVLNREYPGFGRCKWKLIKHVIMITIGLVILLAGTTYVILNIVYYGDALKFDKMSAEMLRDLTVLDYDTKRSKKENFKDLT